MASAELAGIGSVESEPVYYFWNPAYNLLGAVPWLVLAGLFVLLRENRRGQALWIMVPALIIYAMMRLTLNLTGLPSDAVQIFSGIYDSLVIGFAAIWLLGERIGGRHRFVTWLLSLVILAIFIGLTLFNLSLGIEMIAIAVFFAVSAAILLISLPLGAVMCRKRFGPVRFCLWTGFWIAILAFTILMSISLIQIMVAGLSAAEYMLQFAFAALIYAGTLIIGLLPFEVLLFTNDFWRKRFEKVFGIAARPAAAATEPIEPPVSV